MSVVVNLQVNSRARSTPRAPSAPRRQSFSNLRVQIHPQYIAPRADLVTDVSTFNPIEMNDLNPSGIATPGVTVYFPVYPGQNVAAGLNKTIFHKDQKKRLLIDILHVYSKDIWENTITVRHPMKIYHNGQLPVGGCLFRVIKDIS